MIRGQDLDRAPENFATEFLDRYPGGDHRARARKRRERAVLVIHDANLDWGLRKGATRK
jgi:hypothetical protein